MPKLDDKRWGLAVETCYSSCVTREADPDDSWGADDISHSHSVLGLRLVGEHEHGGSADLALRFEPVAGETLHLVWARHSTGDSFHTESGLMTPLAAFRSKGLADLARAEFEAMDGDASRAGIFDEDGEVFMVSVPWGGYFDTLEGVEVESFEVKRAPAPRRGARSGGGSK